jgi:hypothetical protein
MKKAFTLAGLFFASLAIMALNVPADEDMIHVSVVHHEGATVMVYDTTFAVSSGYTVEKFLLDNGLSPEKTEIIYADELEGPHTHELSKDIWFMQGSDDLEMTHRVLSQERQGPEGAHMIKRIKHEGDGGSLGEKFEIVKTVDDDGNVSIKKYVNGEEVPFKEGDHDWIDNEGIHIEVLENIMIIDEESFDDEKVVILHESGEEGEGQPYVIQRVVKGEPGMRKSGDTEMIEMNVEVEEIINAEGETEVQILANGELIDESEHDQYLNIEGGEGNIEIIIINDSGEGEEGEVEFIIETEDIFVVKGECEGGNEFIFDGMSNADYTIAIVSSGEEIEPVPSNESSGPTAKSTMQKHELAIDELKFYPNPSQGQFNLTFNLPKKGKTQILIYDMQGKKVHEQDLGRFSGKYNADINLSDAGPGTYILNIIQGNKKIAEKLIVQ